MTRFQMSRIGVNQFAILREHPAGGELKLSTELSFHYSAEGKQIACITDFKFSDTGGVVLILSCQCTFLVHPDDWAAFETPKGFIIPQALLEILATHTIGTSRGILFCRTEGTAFNSLMIPPIDVPELMEHVAPSAHKG